MNELRKKLGELDRHEKLRFDEIEKLRPKFGHSIYLANQSPVEEIANSYLNCVMYAFDLKFDDWYRAIAADPKIIRKTKSRSKQPDYSIFADTEFVDYCIDKRLISEISGREPESDDLVVYSDSERCRHVGKKISHGRIRSKWGLMDLLEHGLFEVQDTFGNTDRYFEALDYEQSRCLFTKYAWSVVEDDPQTKIHLRTAIESQG